MSLSVPSCLAPSKLTVNHKWSRPYRWQRARLPSGGWGLVLLEMSLFRLISNQLFGLSTRSCVCGCVCVYACTCAPFIRYKITPVCFLSAWLTEWQINSSLLSESQRSTKTRTAFSFQPRNWETNHLRRSPWLKLKSPGRLANVQVGTWMRNTLLSTQDVLLVCFLWKHQSSHVLKWSYLVRQEFFSEMWKKKSCHASKISIWPGRMAAREKLRLCRLIRLWAVGLHLVNTGRGYCSACAANTISELSQTPASPTRNVNTRLTAYAIRAYLHQRCVTGMHCPAWSGLTFDRIRCK